MMLTKQPIAARKPSGILAVFSARRLAKIAVSVVVAGMAMSSAACSHFHERPASMAVPLEFRPTDNDSGAISLSNPGAKVYILPVEDKRAQKDRIGENREEAIPVVITAADKTPADYVRDALGEQLRKNGVNVVASPDDADRLIAVSLTTFWVQEAPNYHADILATVQVQDKLGRTLWTGTVPGDNSTFGNSLKAENYQQVLSNAMVKVSENLLSSPQFQQSLVASAPAVPAPGPGPEPMGTFPGH